MKQSLWGRQLKVIEFSDVRAAMARWGIVVVMLCAGSVPAIAQSELAATDGDPGSAAMAVAVVDGFRSAKFGMSEGQVLEAVATDFGLSDDDVVIGENRAERTRVLTAMVPDLLHEGGTAQVSYVLGYRSGGLIQVGISWSLASDPEMTEARLQANAEVLVAHFQSLGYVPESIRSGLLLDTGVLLFRGEDADGRSTILLMQGQFGETEDGQRALSPVALSLLYAADSDNPDVFVIEQGQF